MYYAAGIVTNNVDYYQFIIMIKDGIVKWAQHLIVPGKVYRIDKLVGKGDYSAYGAGSNYDSVGNPYSDGIIVFMYT